MTIKRSAFIATLGLTVCFIMNVFWQLGFYLNFLKYEPNFVLFFGLIVNVIQFGVLIALTLSLFRAAK
jgi:hypothetical protein